MKVALPDIPEPERTPLVLLLLDIIHQQQERIALLEDEIAALKGLKPRPTIQPSTLETPKPTVPTTQPAKRPGSDKRPKNAQLTIHREIILPLHQPPPDAVFKGYQDYVVQDLVIEVRTTRYRRERWQTADGRTLVAALPDDVIPGSHFGPTLHTFVLYEYYHQRVTQPLILEGLRQWGVDISAGQVNNLLTEGRDAFHQEKQELLPAGLQVSRYVGVDDTGARHQGQTGYCTHIGNDLFAFFESTDSKSRVNFLEILRQPHTDYVVNDVARDYWTRQKLPGAVFEVLGANAGIFPDQAAWQMHLTTHGVMAERHQRIATEGALLGSLTTHGVSTALVILSDGAPQFDVLVHAACWLHAERPLARMVPYNEQHRAAIAKVRGKIWDMYQELKAYQAKPMPSAKATLESQFDALCGTATGFPSVDGVLGEMAKSKADLLRVLDRPEVPLHNNTSERHIREYVTKRKVSGGTRSESGRRCRDTFLSLKKTCRALRVNFWEYLRDRLRGLGLVPRLSELIRCRAAAGVPGSVAAAPA